MKAIIYIRENITVTKVSFCRNVLPNNMTNFISKAFSYFFLNLHIVALSFFYNFLLLSLIIAIYAFMGEIMLLNTK